MVCDSLALPLSKALPRPPTQRCSAVQSHVRIGCMDSTFSSPWRVWVSTSALIVWPCHMTSSSYWWTSTCGGITFGIGAALFRMMPSPIKCKKRKSLPLWILLLSLGTWSSRTPSLGVSPHGSSRWRLMAGLMLIRVSTSSLPWNRQN